MVIRTMKDSCECAVPTQGGERSQLLYDAMHMISFQVILEVTFDK